MIEYEFTIPGRPVGRQEPLAGRYGNWYLPKKTKVYYEHIRNSFQQKYPRLNDKTHRWHVNISIYIFGSQYPDNSNVIKAIEDALQGCIWHNDKQIWSGLHKRVQVKDKTFQRVEVEAKTIKK